MAGCHELDIRLQRTVLTILGLVVCVAASVVWADIDLSDFDDDVMRTMDDTIKSFEPDIAAKNAKAATDDAAVLQENLKWTEQYFASKGNADDAVKWARQGQEQVATALKAVTSQDFDAASTAARTAAKNCKTCHDVYKPLTK
jgi:cytochrome c556